MVVSEHLEQKGPTWPRELEGVGEDVEGPIPATRTDSRNSATRKNKIPTLDQAPTLQGPVSHQSTSNRSPSPSAWWLDCRQGMWDGDTPLSTEVSCAALRAIVSEAVREAVRDEFLAFRSSGDHQRACVDGAGRPVYKPRGPSAAAEHADEPVALESGLEQPATASSSLGAKGAPSSPEEAQASTSSRDFVGKGSTAKGRRDHVGGAFKRMLRKTPSWKTPSSSPRLDESITELDEQEKEVLKTRSLKLHDLTSNSCAEKVTACLIFINAVTIGFQSDMILRGHIELGRQLQYVNWALVFVFVVELAVRMGCSRRNFFRKRHLAWNLFDLFTVTSSALDVLLQLSSSSLQIEQVSYLRIIRILRVLKAFRIIRILPFFRELRMMVAGVLNCSKPLLWAIALMFLVSYMFATMVAQACSGDALLLDEPVDCKYGTMIEIMFILFQATTGGMDWGTLADELLEWSLLLVAVLCLYILVVTLVIVNVITAVFVQAALEQKQDPEELLVDTIQRKRRWLRHVKRFFERCDKDPEGAMSVEQLVHVLDQNDARSSLATLGIDAQFIDWSTLHVILDANGDGKVTLEEFARCLQSMRGSARSSDMMVLRHDIKKLLREGNSSMA